MPGGPARSRAYTNNYDTINDFFYGRGLSGVSPAEFVGMLVDIQLELRVILIAS